MESHQDVINYLVDRLLESERVVKYDLYSEVQLTGREAGLALWYAREKLRAEHGIVFGNLRGFPGTIYRLDTKRTIQQADRQRAGGRRKIARALDKYAVAEANAASDAERELASRAAARAHMGVARFARKLKP